MSPPEEERPSMCDFAAFRALGVAPILALALLLGSAPRACAQTTGSLQGIVSIESSGQVLTGAFVALESGGVEVRSVLTDRNGLYLIGGLAPGSYTLRVRFLGYSPYTQPVTFAAGTNLTVNIGLESAPIVLEGVEVDIPEVGVVIRELGRQTVTPTELRRIPTPAASGDLATYLQTLPGVVTTGDRGGQMFIRGGTHTENMTLMDGMMIYQPFHILGAFSVFPEDLFASADFYAGGFGARYSGRTSSVLDVRMRDGDRTSYHGGGSIGPVLAEVTVEGPMGDKPISWIFSARRSLLDETSESFLGEPVPLTFESQFLKLTSFTDDPHSRCSLTAVRSADHGRMDAEDEVSRVGWENLGIGTRCVALFTESSLRLVDVGVAYSRVENEAITRGAAELVADVGRFQVDMNFTNLIGSRRIEWGAYGRTKRIKHDLIELFGGNRTEEVTWDGGAYAEVTFFDGERFTFVPGVALSFVPTLSADPRVRASWRPWGDASSTEFTGAVGIYRQGLTGISDVRDASSVFVAWKRYNEGDDPMTSIHAQLGWQQTIGKVNASLEGYYRDMRNISVPLWAVTTMFNTTLGQANGKTHGVDARLEYLGDRLYGFVGYGYGSTTYTSAQQYFSLWFGEPVQSYRPPHDRRHQVNVVASMEVGEFDIGARWQLGTGLPYTRPMGFDEFFDYRFDLPDPHLRYGQTRMIVEKPYLGRLPAIHRLDLSVQRSFGLSFGTLEARGGAMNLYDRTNIFYYDIYTQRRVDQLPLFPYVAVKFTGG